MHEPDWAAEHLQTIRTLMERSAIYRRALAPIMTFCGVMGVVAGVVGWQLNIDSDRGFVLFWSGVATAALLGSFLLARRQALKDVEPFWSPPTRRIAQAMLPPLLIGLLFGVVAAVTSQNTWDESLILVTIWALLYGLALHAAGFFMPRGIRLFGWGFLIAGVALLAIVHGDFAPHRDWSAHWSMGILFGVSHLLYGIYLHLTEPRKNAP